MKNVLLSRFSRPYLRRASGIQRMMACLLVLLLVLAASVVVPNVQAQLLHPDWKPEDPTENVGGSSPGTSISKLITFDGRYHYAMIGATESKNESTKNCDDIGPQTRTLTLPSGATVEKAYLYWSGSWDNSGADERVKLNNDWVDAERTFTEYVNGGWNMRFYGAFADVTDHVSGNGSYKVSYLDWSKDRDFCNSYAAYGGWSLIVVYEDASLPESILHVYDGFDGGDWYPSRTYEVKLRDLEFPSACALEAEIGLLIWEGDSYKTEKLRINGQRMGSSYGNTLNGSTDANLDFDIYDISNIATPGSTKLPVSVETWVNNGGREWYIHNAFVVKYNKCGSDLSCDATKLIEWTNVTPGKDGNDDPVAGDLIEFTMPISNDGPVAVTNSQARFYFPDDIFNVISTTTSSNVSATSSSSGGIETVTFTIGSLASGATENLVIRLQVDAGSPSTGTVVAEVIASPQTDPDSTPADLGISFNSSSGNIDVIPNPTQDDECTVTFNQLPVELTAFDARLDGNSTTLLWATASETNNAGFEVQHRYAGETAKSAVFDVLDWVNGHGTTEAAQSYTFRVDNLEPGRHVFRLKQIDFDGTFDYSPEIEVDVDMADSFVMETAYPNPFNPEATFRFAVRAQQEVIVELYNMLGQRVQTLYQGTPEAGLMQQVTIDGSSLTSGTYLIRAMGGSFVKTQTVSLVK